MMAQKTEGETAPTAGKTVLTEGFQTGAKRPQSHLSRDRREGRAYEKVILRVMRCTIRYSLDCFGG